MNPLMELNIEKMTRKDFLALPKRKWNEDIGWFDSIIVLPMRHLHDSGYALMDFVACVEHHPVCRLSGCSDVLELGGTAFVFTGHSSFHNSNIGFSIDCLPKSKLLRIFPRRGKMRCSAAFSTFEVYANYTSQQNNKQSK